MFRLEVCDAWAAFGLSRETTGQFITSRARSAGSEPPSAAGRAREAGGFGNPAVMRSATIALAADDAVADIRRAMTIITEAKDILRTATARLRATPQGAGYAAYKAAMAFLEKNQ